LLLLLVSGNDPTLENAWVANINLDEEF